MLSFSQNIKALPSDHVYRINADLERAVLDLLTVRIIKHAGDFSIVIGGFTSGGVI